MHVCVYFVSINLAVIECKWYGKFSFVCFVNANAESTNPSCFCFHAKYLLHRHVHCTCVNTVENTTKKWRFFLNWQSVHECLEFIFCRFYFPHLHVINRRSNSGGGRWLKLNARVLGGTAIEEANLINSFK